MVRGQADFFIPKSLGTELSAHQALDTTAMNEQSGERITGPLRVVASPACYQKQK